nr:MAG TPA: hypothetical protein [Caudoviricetes sp.]
MTIVMVVSIALMLAISAVAIAVEARSECRELLRVQREWMERMTDDTRD